MKTIKCPKCGAEITIEFDNNGNVTSCGHAEDCTFSNPNLSTRQRARLEALTYASATGQIKGHFFAMENGGAIGTIKDGKKVALDEQELDAIESSLYSNGYVKNTRLFRRWVLPQMMSALNYKSHEGDDGFVAWLHAKGYEYSWRTIVEELRVLDKLRRSDHESYAERSRFFTKDTAVSMAEDYLATLTSYIDGLKVRKYRGQPYKRIHGSDILIKDLERKVYAPVKQGILALKRANESNLARTVSVFNKKRTLISFDAPLSHAFLNAYRGAGAFYALKNLVMFHDCVVIDGDRRMTMYESLDYINAKATKDMANGEGYKLLGFLKEFLDLNGFDYIDRLKKLGVIAA